MSQQADATTYLINDTIVLQKTVNAQEQIAKVLEDVVTNYPPYEQLPTHGEMGAGGI